jgi:hypothetical protein
VQPLLILRKQANITFDDVMLKGEWSINKTEQVERDYLSICAVDVDC